mmetsp:Transcript_86397/g.268483  ORF Transcript_86397/g.268483 Transcript_86397/m.268483 type:complete len:84 (-) Transcript_86397:31-282(-)
MAAAGMEVTGPACAALWMGCHWARDARGEALLLTLLARPCYVEFLGPMAFVLQVPAQDAALRMLWSHRRSAKAPTNEEQVCST